MSQEWTLYLDAEPGVCPSAVVRPAPPSGHHDGSHDDSGDGEDEQGGGGGRSSAGRLAKLVKWRLRPSLPLAAAHNASALQAALGLESVNAVWLFHRRQQGSPSPTRNGGGGDASGEDAQTPADDVASSSPLGASAFLDPSCTPLELLLHDGAVVLATSDPMRQLESPAVAGFAGLRALPGFASATLRFAAAGGRLELVGRSQRKAVRIGANGWAGGVAMVNAPFDSEDGGVASLSFRVSMTKLRSTTAADNARGGVDADGLRVPPAIGEELPVAAIGVIDESFDPESDTATAFGGAHNKAWLLNTVSGQLFAGSKALTVDRQQFTPGPSVTITLTMDTAKGAVFLTQNGRHIGGFQVSKFLADGMYACVELYTHGATVELL